MQSGKRKWGREVAAVLDDARDDVGDWMAAIEFTADDLAAAGLTQEAERLREALAIAQAGGHADWLALIEGVADELLA